MIQLNEELTAPVPQLPCKRRMNVVARRRHLRRRDVIPEEKNGNQFWENFMTLTPEKEMRKILKQATNMNVLVETEIQL